MGKHGLPARASSADPPPTAPAARFNGAQPPGGGPLPDGFVPTQDRPPRGFPPPPAGRRPMLGSDDHAADDDDWMGWDKGKGTGKGTKVKFTGLTQTLGQF
jgi:hypothetical protein